MKQYDRFTRRPPSERRKEPATLPKRHQQILEHVYAARYLTNRMIQRLVYRPATFSWCKEDLRDLFDWGYLDKRKVGRNDPDIYFLDVKGRHWIARMGLAEREAVNRISGRPGGMDLFMSHELSIGQIYTAAVIQCREYGYYLSWKNARMLELERLDVQPDAYIWVQGKNEPVEAFIEFSDVIPRRAEIQGRLEAYKGLWSVSAPVPILWFTTTRRKISQLRSAVNSWLYSDYVAVGSMEDVNGFLTKKMWWWSESVEPVAWIIPSEEVLYSADSPP